MQPPQLRAFSSTVTQSPLPLGLRRVAIAALGAGLFGAGASAQQWRLAQPAQRPMARAGHMMAFDDARARTVLFGGYHETQDQYFHDTWEFDGENWNQIATPQGPTGREFSGVCYDAQRGVVVLFGGYRRSTVGSPTYFGDTWEFDGTSWQSIPSPGPAARLTDMCYDSHRGVVVLYGGSGNTSPFLHRDTWEYDGTAWTQRTSTNRPSWFADRSLAFDEGRGVTVLFQGYTLGNSTPAQTWEWDGIDWTRVTTATSAPVMSRPALTWDAQRGKLVAIGAGFVGPTETWGFDGVDWQLLPNTSLPATRSGHAVVCDRQRGALVQFGGNVAAGTSIVESDETLQFATWAAVTTLGVGCANNGTTPVLAAAAGSEPRAGSTFTSRVTGLAVGDLAVLVFGTSTTSWNGAPLPTSLTAIGLPGCELLVSVDVTTAMSPVGNAADGSLTVPSNPGLHGAELFEQGVVLDAAGFRGVSNALAVTIGL